MNDVRQPRLDERDGDDWFQRRIDRLPERLGAAID